MHSRIKSIMTPFIITMSNMIISTQQRKKGRRYTTLHAAEESSYAHCIRNKCIQVIGQIHNKCILVVLELINQFKKNTKPSNSPAPNWQLPRTN